MKDKLFKRLDEENIFLDDMDIYTEEAREKEVENDELDCWEAAWMQGYEEAR